MGTGGRAGPTHLGEQPSSAPVTPAPTGDGVLKGGLGSQDVLGEGGSGCSPRVLPRSHPQAVWVGLGGVPSCHWGPTQALRKEAAQAPP